MTERFAYFAFLGIVGLGLTLMTALLATVGFFLVRQNRAARRHPDSLAAVEPGRNGTGTDR
jgi:hypothetical protein